MCVPNFLFLVFINSQRSLPSLINILCHNDGLWLLSHNDTNDYDRLSLILTVIFRRFFDFLGEMCRGTNLKFIWNFLVRIRKILRCSHRDLMQLICVAGLVFD